MPNKGAKASRYQVGGFELTVFDQAYLVEVKTAPSNPAEPHLISGLPEWVFLSRHAIWLTDDEADLADRDRKGNQIKQSLIKQIGTHL